MVERDIISIKEATEQEKPQQIMVTHDQVLRAICKLNTAKAPDVDGLTAEHHKNAGIL